MKRVAKIGAFRQLRLICTREPRYVPIHLNSIVEAGEEHASIRNDYGRPNKPTAAGTVPW
jgi:hypothetical protein